MYFSYVTDEEVYTLFKKLKNKKSIGFDGIDVKILKRSVEMICNYLCIGLNKCISESIFPRTMKTVKVIPIHKEGKKGIHRATIDLSPSWEIYQNSSRKLFKNA